MQECTVTPIYCHPKSPANKKVSIHSIHLFFRKHLQGRGVHDEKAIYMNHWKIFVWNHWKIFVWNHWKQAKPICFWQHLISPFSSLITPHLSIFVAIFHLSSGWCPYFYLQEASGSYSLLQIPPPSLLRRNFPLF